MHRKHVCVGQASLWGLVSWVHTYQGSTGTSVNIEGGLEVRTPFFKEFKGGPELNFSD